MTNPPSKSRSALFSSDPSQEKSPSSVYKGFALTPGVAYGRALFLNPENVSGDAVELSIEDISGEIDKFKNTLSLIKEEVLSLQKQVTGDVGESEGAIFEFQSQVLNDVGLMENIIQVIRDKKVKMGRAINDVLEQKEQSFAGVKNPYFKDKLIDVRDVLLKLKEHERLKSMRGLFESVTECILFTNVVNPSIIPPSATQKTKGLVTKVGGLGSHATILARSYGIPSVGLTTEMIGKVKDGDQILIDGHAGIVFVNPAPKVLEDYHHTIQEFEVYRARVVKQASQTVQTKDGHPLAINANCSTEVDINQAHQNGADGIGLFRTEFMFHVHSSFPLEEEQFQIYKEVLSRFPDKPVVFRTLDIGGDKFLPYFSLPHQLNPFLGWRSLKISFELPHLFKAQMKAILRAARWGPARILFPMVTSYHDIITAKRHLQASKEELAGNGIEFNDRIPCGAMIETPSAVVCFDDIAKEVDFVTIGTNDLTQHMLAVDRNNARVAPFYISHHPAVISVIEEIIRKADALGKPVSLCGEMASNPYYAYLLMGLGLTNMSMVPSAIPIIKDMVRNIRLRDAREMADHVKGLKYSDRILEYLKKKTVEHYPDVTKVLK